MGADEDKCRAAGIDGCLSKPIDPDVFKTKLKQYLV
jgi:CheY-like chemotaxis protein